MADETAADEVTDAAVETVADETVADAALETAADTDGAAELEMDSDVTEIAQADVGSDSMEGWVDPVDAPVEELGDSTPESDDSNASEMDSPLAAIYGIEFDGQDNRDRIVVLGDAPIEYKLFEPTTETVIVSLMKAKIDPEAAVRITPEPGGPVSLVTAFDQPEMEEPEVRLVVQRAANLEPQISRRGSLLIIDFPHTGGMAAAPPAMTQDQAMGAQAELDGVPASNSSAADDDDSMIRNGPRLARIQHPLRRRSSPIRRSMFLHRAACPLTSNTKAGGFRSTSRMSTSRMSCASLPKCRNST